MGDEKSNVGQSGGVNIGGGTVTVGGDIVGRDKIVGTEISHVQLDQIFRPLEEAVRTAPPERRAEAMQKLEEGLVGLVPTAVSAVVGAFATPLLGAFAGPATKYVLDKIQGR